MYEHLLDRSLATEPTYRRRFSKMALFAGTPPELVIPLHNPSSPFVEQNNSLARQQTVYSDNDCNEMNFDPARGELRPSWC